MARCDFEIIDNDQDEPTDTHMYLLQAPADTHTNVQRRLTRIVTGNTTSEAVVDLLEEAAQMCRDVYNEDGIQLRCVTVFLHAARLKPLVMKNLGRIAVF